MLTFFWARPKLDSVYQLGSVKLVQFRGTFCLKTPVSTPYQRHSVDTVSTPDLTLLTDLTFKSCHIAGTFISIHTDNFFSKIRLGDFQPKFERNASVNSIANYKIHSSVTERRHCCQHQCQTMSSASTSTLLDTLIIRL